MTDFEGPVITGPDLLSREAAASVEPYAGSMRRRTWLLIQSRPDGLACWEVEQITHGLHQTVSATINWLWKRGWLKRVGFNKTPSNRRAYIYQAIRPTLDEEDDDA